MLEFSASNQPLRTMSKTALILATDGTEDMELVITANILRRANVNVTIAGLKGSDTITLARQVKMHPDKKLSEVLSTMFDSVVLPGGPGYKEYADKHVGELLKRHEINGKLIAAICAGPVGLKFHGIAKGAMVTSYPSVKDELIAAGYKYSEDNVVVSSNVDLGHGSAAIVTSKGPGTTFEFALKIVELLAGGEVENNVRKALLL